MCLLCFLWLSRFPHWPGSGSVSGRSQGRGTRGASPLSVISWRCAIPNLEKGCVIHKGQKRNPRRDTKNDAEGNRNLSVLPIRHPGPLFLSRMIRPSWGRGPRLPEAVTPAAACRGFPGRREGRRHPPGRSRPRRPPPNGRGWQSPPLQRGPSAFPASRGPRPR